MLPSAAWPRAPVGSRGAGGDVRGVRRAHGAMARRRVHAASSPQGEGGGGDAGIPENVSLLLQFMSRGVHEENGLGSAALVRRSLTSAMRAVLPGGGLRGPQVQADPLEAAREFDEREGLSQEFEEAIRTEVEDIKRRTENLAGEAGVGTGISGADGESASGAEDAGSKLASISPRAPLPHHFRPAKLRDIQEAALQSALCGLSYKVKHWPKEKLEEALAVYGLGERLWTSHCDIRSEDGGWTAGLDWYVCEGTSGSGRSRLPKLYCVIQGSDAPSHWIANLTFDPVVFENPTYNTLVHRGIYDIAITLLQQFEPVIASFLERNPNGKIAFTGHSLGGGIAAVLTLLAHMRLKIPAATFLGTYMIGAPSCLSSADGLFAKIEMDPSQFRSVMLEKDIVPRAFACDYPETVVDLLCRLNENFATHTKFRETQLLYNPMGTMYLLTGPDGLQVGDYGKASDGFESLPSRTGIHSLQGLAVQRFILNHPHPLELLADTNAYGPEGGVSRYHNPDIYTAALNASLAGFIRSEGPSFPRPAR